MAQDVIYSGEVSVCTWEKGKIDCFQVKCPIDINLHTSQDGCYPKIYKE